LYSNWKHYELKRHQEFKERFQHHQEHSIIPEEERARARRKIIENGRAISGKRPHIDHGLSCRPSPSFLAIPSFQSHSWHISLFLDQHCMIVRNADFVRKTQGARLLLVKSPTATNICQHTQNTGRGHGYGGQNTSGALCPCPCSNPPDQQYTSTTFCFVPHWQIIVDVEGSSIEHKHYGSSRR
jgi:hypothetical protein